MFNRLLKKAELKQKIAIAEVTGYPDEAAQYTKELEELNRKERKQ